MILKACGEHDRYSYYAAQIFYKVDSNVKLYVMNNLLFGVLAIDSLQAGL